MKLSYVVSTHETSFTSVASGNLENKVRIIASLGYDGVELAIRDPGMLDVSSIRTLLKKCGLQLAAIGTGQAYVDEGLFFSSTDAGITKQAIERIKGHIDLAAQFESQVIVGLLRGEGIKNKFFSADQFKKSLREICAYAEKKNTRIVIEPINRYETSLINCVREALDIIQEINSASLYILADTFHMNIEEQQLPSTLTIAAPKLAHVHIADSDRWYPGHGHIDFEAIVTTLKQINYQGFLSGEMLPKPDFETAAKKTIQYMKDKITRY